MEFTKVPRALYSSSTKIQKKQGHLPYVSSTQRTKDASLFKKTARLTSERQRQSPGDEEPIRWGGRNDVADLPDRRGEHSSGATDRRIREQSLGLR